MELLRPFRKKGYFVPTARELADRLEATGKRLCALALFDHPRDVPATFVVSDADGTTPQAIVIKNRAPIFDLVPGPGDRTVPRYSAGAGALEDQVMYADGPFGEQFAILGHKHLKTLIVEWLLHARAKDTPSNDRDGHLDQDHLVHAGFDYSELEPIPLDPTQWQTKETFLAMERNAQLLHRRGVDSREALKAIKNQVDSIEKVSFLVTLSATLPLRTAQRYAALLEAAETAARLQRWRMSRSILSELGRLVASPPAKPISRRIARLKRALPKTDDTYLNANLL